MTRDNDNSSAINAAEAFPSVEDASGRTFGQDELDAVSEVLRSGHLSSVGGKWVRLLEKRMAEVYHGEHVVACSSGTAALHMAVGAVDPEPGDEIITTPLSDFGTVIPILAQNAVPVFADVDTRTGNLDPASVEHLISHRTRAIIAVHLFGAPAPIVELANLAHRHGLILIEDCAQAYLAVPQGGDRPVGCYGDIGCFSLQQSKHVTCGDGGLAITSNAEFAERMRLFSDKGWSRDGGRSHDFLGLNYRMTELQGAVAYTQLGRLDEVVSARRASGTDLVGQLGRLRGVYTPDGDGHAFWMFPLVLDPEIVGGNLEWQDGLLRRGVPALAGYLPSPLYAFPVLREGRTYGHSRFPLTRPPARRTWTYPDGLCPRAERLVDETLLVIPWNERYASGHVDRIAGAISAVHREQLNEDAGPSGKRPGPHAEGAATNTGEW